MQFTESSGGRGLRKVFWLAFFLILGLLPARVTGDDFATPPGLEPQVEFWRRVFTEWSEHQVAIHDDFYTDRVYSVVDLSAEADRGWSAANLRVEKRKRVKVEIERIGKVLARLQRVSKNLTEEEQRVSSLLKGISGSNRYLAARGRLRSQTGMKERFKEAIGISRRYLPHMEEIFRDEGLPLELTRMPFIESTFNVAAYSKVGAAGVWQFMPSSARAYQMSIDEVVDERRDPLLATRAAAHHLRDDYARLGSWPLAVTAYNHGRSGIARAVRTVGSEDLMEIIREYRGRSFGFASRNFYASFLAALAVDRKAAKYFTDIKYDPKFIFDDVEIPDYVAFSTLAGVAGVSVQDLHDLNPAFEKTVVVGKLYVPRGSQIRVPQGKASAFRTAYAALPDGKLHDSQRDYIVRHRVRGGQTVSWLAHHYGTTAMEIQAMNKLRSINRIRAGQILKIPKG